MVCPLSFFSDEFHMMMMMHACPHLQALCVCCLGREVGVWLPETGSRSRGRLCSPSEKNIFAIRLTLTLRRSAWLHLRELRGSVRVWQR